MRNNIRLFPIHQVYTRRSCICNKSFHIHKLTGRTLHFGKIMLAASYNILFTSIVTLKFAQNENDQNIGHDHRPQAPHQEDSENENQDKIYPRLQLVDYNNRPAVPV